jgi:hypothetical protein
VSMALQAKGFATEPGVARSTTYTVSGRNPTATTADGNQRHVPLLLASRELTLLALGPGSEIVADRHAEAVGEQVGETEDHDDRVAEICARGTGDDRERGHGSVDRPVDEVPQVARRRGLARRRPIASLVCCRRSSGSARAARPVRVRLIRPSLVSSSASNLSPSASRRAVIGWPVSASRTRG